MNGGWDGLSQYMTFNRFENLDSIELKIIEKLINSDSKYADYLWKLLKYYGIDALSKDEVSHEERLALVSTSDNGEYTGKRIFLTPRTDSSQGDQCSSVYIYVDTLEVINQNMAVVGVTIDTCVYTNIGVVSWDYDPDLNDNSNPNDDNGQNSIVVPYKSRETVLLKCLLAEISGIFIDGVGSLGFQIIKSPIDNQKFKSTVSLNNELKDKYHGHTIKLVMSVSGISDSSDIGY